jgi:orotidine-5'-phosphate decarboxylase
MLPGTAAANSERHDHKYALTPQAALKAGADYIVIGRPISQSSNPRTAVQEILTI